MGHSIHAFPVPGSNPMSMPLLKRRPTRLTEDFEGFSRFRLDPVTVHEREVVQQIRIVELL